MAIAESILSDSKGLRCHFRVAFLPLADKAPPRGADKKCEAGHLHGILKNSNSNSAGLSRKRSIFLSVRPSTGRFPRRPVDLCASGASWLPRMSLSPFPPPPRGRVSGRIDLRAGHPPSRGGKEGAVMAGLVQACPGHPRVHQVKVRARKRGVRKVLFLQAFYQRRTCPTCPGVGEAWMAGTIPDQVRGRT
jgi:hypothetical protein